jgi:hypothetical protein
VTREDLFCEVSDVAFALTPSVANRLDSVSLEDIEDVRRQMTERLDKCAMRVSMDTEFTPDDAADDALDLELEVGLD